MATNPNRPEYQDTIESTWGQSVADHVIRRYATPAERDADLAALTPADLEGQLVNVAGDLQEYTHGAWTVRPLVMPGMSVITTDAFGNAVIALPAGAKWRGVVCNGANVSVPMLVTVNHQDGPVGSATVIFSVRHPDGSGWANVAADLSYVITFTYN